MTAPIIPTIKAIDGKNHNNKEIKNTKSDWSETNQRNEIMKLKK